MQNGNVARKVEPEDKPAASLMKPRRRRREGRILTLLLAECGRPRPQQARDFLSAQENHRHAVFATLLRPRTGALL
jgi:hypothetical protein